MARVHAHAVSLVRLRTIQSSRQIETLIEAGLLDCVARNDVGAIGIAVGKVLERPPAEQADADATRVYVKVSGEFVDLLE